MVDFGGINSFYHKIRQMPRTMNRIPLSCLGSTLNFELCQPQQPATLCPGDALKLIAGDRKLPSWEVCGNGIQVVSTATFLGDFRIVILRCSEASKYSGQMLISLSLLHTNYPLTVSAHGPEPFNPIQSLITANKSGAPSRKEILCRFVQ